MTTTPQQYASLLAASADELMNSLDKLSTYQYVRNWTLAAPMAFVLFVAFFGGFIQHWFFQTWKYVEGAFSIIFAVLNAILVCQLFGNHTDSSGVLLWMTMDLFLLVNGCLLLVATSFKLWWFERLIDFNWTLIALFNTWMLEPAAMTTNYLRAFAGIVFLLSTALFSGLANRYIHNASETKALNQQIAVSLLYLLQTAAFLMIGCAPVTLTALISFVPSWDASDGVFIFLWVVLGVEFLATVVVGFVFFANAGGSGAKASAIVAPAPAGVSTTSVSVSHPGSWKWA